MMNNFFLLHKIYWREVANTSPSPQDSRKVFKAGLLTQILPTHKPSQNNSVVFLLSSSLQWRDRVSFALNFPFNCIIQTLKILFLSYVNYTFY